MYIAWVHITVHVYVIKFCLPLQIHSYSGNMNTWPQAWSNYILEKIRAIYNYNTVTYTTYHITLCVSVTDSPLWVTFSVSLTNGPQWVLIFVSLWPMAHVGFPAVFVTHFCNIHYDILITQSYTPLYVLNPFELPFPASWQYRDLIPRRRRLGGWLEGWPSMQSLTRDSDGCHCSMWWWNSARALPSFLELL